MDIIFNYLEQNMVKGAGFILSSLSAVSIDLFSNSTVMNVLNFINFMGYILMAVGILFAISNMYIRYVEDGAIQVHLLIVNIIKSIIAVIFMQPGAIAVFTISVIIQKLMQSFITVPEYSTSLSKIISIVAIQSGSNQVWTFIIGLVAVVSIIIVLVQCLKRSGIYLIQIMVGYLYLFSIPSGNNDGFIMWCKQIVAIAFTNTVQIALLMIGMMLMTNTLGNVFLGIGVILSATSVEKVAGQFGMSVNSRQSLGAAVRTAKETSQLASTAIKGISKIM